jgi:outer membrane lipoprotein SlyB
VGTPEMKERFGQSTYTIAVRMDDGTTRSVQRGDGAQYHAGDRVRLPVGGGLELVSE